MGELQMDIVRFKGGLGNQMFQYAFIEALKSRGREVKASLGYKESSIREFSLCTVFPDINLEYVSDSEFNLIDEKWRKIKENNEKKSEFCRDYKNRFFWVEDVIKEPGVYHSNVFLTRNCTFVGYWQSEKYFKDIREKLIESLRFGGVTSELKEFGNLLASGEYTSVHIRRGDYLLYPNVYMGVCTREYYLRAIEYIRQKESNSKFIFFSDDMDWTKKNISIPEAIYYDKSMFRDYQDWYDMYLMSRCQNNIIANSTFSWWGTWLNQSENHIVIAPRKWHQNNDTPDIWCEEWIKL